MLDALRSLRSTRNIAIASVGCVVLGSIACGAEPTAIAPLGSEPVLVGAAPTVYAAPADATPTHGGTVVMAGSYPVEVVPHASGQVYAYVLGDAPPPAGTELNVIVPVTGGVRTVELTWDGGESRWGGRVRRVEIVPGPVDVVLVVGESRWVGHAVTIVVLPAIVIAAPATVVVEYEHGKHRKHRKGRGHGGVFFRH